MELFLDLFRGIQYITSDLLIQSCYDSLQLITFGWTFQLFGPAKYHQTYKNYSVLPICLCFAPERQNLHSEKRSKAVATFCSSSPQVLWQTTHRWAYGRKDRQAEGQTDRWANGHTEDCTDKQDHRQRLASNHADIQSGIRK